MIILFALFYKMLHQTTGFFALLLQTLYQTNSPFTIFANCRSRQLSSLPHFVRAGCVDSKCWLEPPQSSCSPLPLGSSAIFEPLHLKISTRHSHLARGAWLELQERFELGSNLSLQQLHPLPEGAQNLILKEIQSHLKLKRKLGSNMSQRSAAEQTNSGTELK